MKRLIPLLLLFLLTPVGSVVFANVSGDFHGIDFKNRSYPYRFSWGKRVDVRLTNGRYEYDFADERGWFDLKNIYVADLANDSHPEAIVMIWHVACGVSCDGGSALFYIYSFDKHQLKSLWQYETGDLAYGCGLKSFTANRRKLTLELFGRCSRVNRTASATGKSQIKDLTRVTLKSNGPRFVVYKREFVSVPERSVLNFEPQISVSQ